MGPRSILELSIGAICVCTTDCTRNLSKTLKTVLKPVASLFQIVNTPCTECWAGSSRVDPKAAMKSRKVDQTNFSYLFRLETELWCNTNAAFKEFIGFRKWGGNGD
ncbi:unnamed protein product [Trichobilharzia regenti]|nr:unnamed protein product [Trichobilharzia regenti]